MGLDGLSSSAYGPEAALTVLIPAGAAALAWLGWVMAPILALLAILYISYRQTIRAYPTSGGAYRCVPSLFCPASGRQHQTLVPSRRATSMPRAKLWHHRCRVSLGVFHQLLLRPSAYSTGASASSVGSRSSRHARLIE